MSGRYLLALPLAFSACASAQTEVQAPPASDWAALCEDWDEWDKPGPPFRVHSNTYYVGTCGIGAILITSLEGHILIDTGTEQGAQVVLANIRALGFDPADISIILTSHEHFDHVGGLSVLRGVTQAPIYTAPAAVRVLRSGQSSEDDPQHGMHQAMSPVTGVRPIRPGQRVLLNLDVLQLTPLETPGHTPGALSWQWESCDEAGECLTIVYADSMSPVSSDSYRFSDHPEYLAAYRAGIARVAALECDILLTPHPSASDMRDKLLGDGLASGTSCRDYAASITQRLNARLAEEAAQ